MKNKSVLLILFLVVAPLLSACNSKTSITVFNYI